MTLSVKRSQLSAGLEFFNGYGGFAKGGRKYVTILDRGRKTPAPWVNIIANPDFGFHVAVEGTGYTWSGNSRENRITAWSNDPVGDPSGEAFYLRDQGSGEVWSPTAAPLGDGGLCVARHCFGYPSFERTANEIETELLGLVPLADPVKIQRFAIRNRSKRARCICVTSYLEWVLGSTRAANAPSALTAVNRWNATRGSRVAFVDLGGAQTSWTGDRRQFLGRNGSMRSPAAIVHGGPLSGRVGAGLDPCPALQCVVELAPGGQPEVLALVGECDDIDTARALIKRIRAKPVAEILAEVERHWSDVLGAVEVHTPDRAMDIMLDGWLLYQTIACRITARSAFYQASGAYGFRDQLQIIWRSPSHDRS